MSRIEMPNYGKKFVLSAAALGLAAAGCSIPRPRIVFDNPNAPVTKVETPVAGRSSDASPEATTVPSVTATISAGPLRGETAVVRIPTATATRSALPARPDTRENSDRIREATVLEHDFALKPYEEIDLKDTDLDGGSYAVVKGDITIINGKGVAVNTFDNNPDTGDMTVFLTPAKVAAKWGANVTVKLNKLNIEEFLNHNSDLMKQKGCEKDGCKDVRIFVYDQNGLRRMVEGELNQVQVQGRSSEGSAICVDQVLKPGEVFIAPEPGVVSGDVEVQDSRGFVRLYDSSEKTALLVWLKNKGMTIKAPYGGDYSCVPGGDETVIKKIIDQNRRIEAAKGRSVDVVEMPGGQPQK